MTVSDRAQHLLKILVEKYIRDGEPVGSKTLAREARLQLSPATIRNTLADLEERGLVLSPHTSAGRIPTPAGYRLFVDSLLTTAPLEEEHLRRLKTTLDPDKSPHELVESASQLLSEISHMASIVLIPKRDHVMLRQIEFLPLNGNKLLVILVLNDREVQNRIIHTERDYSPEELQQAANFVNQNFAGERLISLRERLLQAMRDDKDRMDQLMQTALDLANKALEQPESQPAIVVAGQTNLLNMADDAGMEKLQEIFEAFRRKRDILHLMDSCVSAEGIQIFIGEESGYKVFGDCSLVTAPYGNLNQKVGVLAVVGPTRMPYQQVIPLVDVTARILGTALAGIEDLPT